MDSGWPMPIPSRKRSLCLAAIRRYEAATSTGSLVHMLTIAVATVIVDVASRMRSAKARSLTDARPNPSHAVGYPSDSARIAKSVRAQLQGEVLRVAQKIRLEDRECPLSATLGLV